MESRLCADLESQFRRAMLILSAAFVSSVTARRQRQRFRAEALMESGAHVCIKSCWTGRPHAVCRCFGTRRLPDFIPKVRWLPENWCAHVSWLAPMAPTPVSVTGLGSTGERHQLARKRSGDSRSAVTTALYLGPDSWSSTGAEIARST